MADSTAKPELGRFRHFMLKEVYEQPQAIRQTVESLVAGESLFPSQLQAVEEALLNCNKIIIAASGSSRHAGLAGEIMIEDLSGIAVDVEYASEYCYRSSHSAADTVVMVITQSGETADTVAAQREALKRGVKTIAVANVAESTIGREATSTLLTHAGLEVAVPATKSFTSQLTVLYLFALFLAEKRGRMNSELAGLHLRHLLQAPDAIQKNLAAWDALAAEFARPFRSAHSFLFLGRAVHYAIAREGALKLKEISYAHAEGYPAGELKHGPNALVHDDVPVIVLATRDREDSDSQLRYEKTLSTLQDIRQHGGRLIAVATEGDHEVRDFAERVFFVPPAPELLLPILEVVPLQLLAYHIAILNNCDVDRPRNLVKAVVRE